eukprot:2133345-Prymnesium_polylepis.1
MTVLVKQTKRVSFQIPTGARPVELVPQPAQRNDPCVLKLAAAADEIGAVKLASAWLVADHDRSDTISPHIPLPALASKKPAQFWKPPAQDDKMLWPHTRSSVAEMGKLTDLVEVMSERIDRTAPALQTARSPVTWSVTSEPSTKTLSTTLSMVNLQVTGIGSHSSDRKDGSVV